MNAPTLDIPAGATAQQRMEALAQVILAYSEITERMQKSHERLEQTVRTLRDELSEKNRLLERRNRLAALGEMAAGIAHEIRNPLGGIQLYASLLATDVAEKPRALDLVKKIAAGVRRLDGLVSQVLQFTREMVARTVPSDLGDIVDEALDLAGETIKARSIRVEIDGPRPLAVQVDPLLMGQAVLNLALNAAQAIDDGGLLRIAFGRPRPGSGEKQFYLVVEDDGPGIPTEILENIFNPFFTTRDTGTGLGLAIVHRIVEAHDGAITAGNRPPRGARFEVRV